MSPVDHGYELRELVDAFVQQTPGVANAVVVSAGGEALAMSRGLDRLSGDQLAAVVSDLSALTQGAARCLDAGAVKQTIVELAHGLLFVQQIADGSALASLTEPTADLGMVGYELAILGARVGAVLDAEVGDPVAVSESGE